MLYRPNMINNFNGNWHWLDYTFTQAEKDAAIELCKKDLQKEA